MASTLIVFDLDSLLVPPRCQLPILHHLRYLLISVVSSGLYLWAHLDLPSFWCLLVDLGLGELVPVSGCLSPKYAEFCPRILRKFPYLSPSTPKHSRLTTQPSFLVLDSSLKLHSMQCSEVTKFSRLGGPKGQTLPQSPRSCGYLQSLNLSAQL